MEGPQGIPGLDTALKRAQEEGAERFEAAVARANALIDEKAQHPDSDPAAVEALRELVRTIKDRFPDSN